MNIYFHYSLLVLLIYSSFLSNKNISCIIIIPFSITNPNYELISNEIDLMSYLYNLSLYSNISIGSPLQQVKMILNFDKYAFSIPNNAYKHEESETYKEIEASKTISDGIEYKGTYSSDNLKLINIDSNDLNQLFQKTDYDKFILDEKYKKIFNDISFVNIISDEQYGYIGFKYPDSNNNLDIFNIVSFLKNRNIINNYAWTFLFETKKDNKIITINDYNKIKGKVIIGDNLYNYYSNKYTYNISNTVNIIQRNGLLNWDLEMSNIYINNNILYISTKVELRPDSTLHFGTFTFKANLDVQFFSQLFNQSICESKNMILFPHIIYYVCDNSKKGENNESFDLQKFPNISFTHKTLNGNFTLTYKDLFIQDVKNKNIFYFLIAFDRKRMFDMDEDRFVLGMKFFEKYKFEFDIDKKLIRYYDIIEINDDETKNDNLNDKTNEKKDHSIILYLGLIILLGVLIFVLGMLFQKKILRIPMKTRANELDDEDFEYKAKSEEKNEDKTLGINE